MSKTYVDEKYRFQFEVPEGWRVWKGRLIDAIPRLFYGLRVRLTKVSKVAFPHIRVRVLTFKQAFPFDLVREGLRYHVHSRGSFIREEKELTVAGQQAYMVSFPDRGIDCIRINLAKGPIAYGIELESSEGNADREAFDQVVRSFRLL